MTLNGHVGGFSLRELAGGHDEVDDSLDPEETARSASWISTIRSNRDSTIVTNPHLLGGMLNILARLPSRSFEDDARPPCAKPRARGSARAI